MTSSLRSAELALARNSGESSCCMERGGRGMPRTAASSVSRRSGSRSVSRFQTKAASSGGTGTEATGVTGALLAGDAAAGGVALRRCRAAGVWPAGTGKGRAAAGAGLRNIHQTKAIATTAAINITK